MRKPIAVFLMSSLDGLHPPYRICQALGFARSRKAGLENEPRILADLANAYALNGDALDALRTVNEAIQVASDRHARIPECIARIVHADLLLRSEGNQEAAETELARARALIEETQANILTPFIDKTREREIQINRLSNQKPL